MQVLITDGIRKENIYGTLEGFKEFTIDTEFLNQNADIVIIED